MNDREDAALDAWYRAHIAAVYRSSKGAEPRLTHGRHCPCSACARQDWAEPGLAHCGMHGQSCPPVYAPVRAALTRKQP